ncbi:MAG: site-2 protease family protein [Candidatus Peregrinibacteria bacterium]|nr:site-2 protease family protein [Candidatus Peregrinibacteria bacterium]
MDYVFQFLVFIIALLIAMTVHEASHALVAYYLGDPTAKIRGRLTLNPIAHLDPVGSLLFLITQRVGWGKPVPVNPMNFKNPVKGSALTSLAGPVSNFILAFVLAIPMKYLGVYLPDFVNLLLWTTFHVSIYLGIFNLLPFPPLDGSGILGLFVPKRFYPQYQNFLHNGVKYFVAIILIDVFIIDSIFKFSFLHYFMGFMHDWVSTILLLGT